jgi:hypothetical protein
MRLKNHIAILVILVVLFGGACTESAATPAPGVTSATPSPTSAPIPTRELAPTIAPTRRPAPAAEPIAQASNFIEVGVWGQTGDDGVTFSSPNAIAIDSFDNVYVTEFRGTRVQKFTPDGILVTRWGSEGDEDGQFRSPTGIAIDRSDHVYVSESGNHRVQEFTSD